ncbi:hypothetical protein [Bacillus sp. RO1]|uniref:hypothetical protein n=1 Tax=Bacillaceae TaxID=186817 RepID=UPI00145730DF|nr:hypothetical protein [Bacillus sp. RO1]NLP52131.1 hypothetical protein [Bacillus sp. RO1]
MVIQSNMSPEAIADAWVETEEIFIKNNIPLTKQPFTFITARIKCNCWKFKSHLYRRWLTNAS